jgi:integrase
VIGLRWDEIDFAHKVWTVPAKRMKAGREHRVPLSDRALAVLTSVPRNGSALAFPLSNQAMSELLKGANGNGFTVRPAPEEGWAIRSDMVNGLPRESE